MYENRIRHLKDMHRILDNRIAEHERNHPHSSEQRLHEMKKQKLHIKDEIAKLKKQNLVLEHK